MHVPKNDLFLHWNHVHGDNGLDEFRIHDSTEECSCAEPEGRKCPLAEFMAHMNALGDDKEKETYLSLLKLHHVIHQMVYPHKEYRRRKHTKWPRVLAMDYVTFAMGESLMTGRVELWICVALRFHAETVHKPGSEVEQAFSTLSKCSSRLSNGAKAELARSLVPERSLRLGLMGDETGERAGSGNLIFTQICALDQVRDHYYLTQPLGADTNPSKVSETESETMIYALENEDPEATDHDIVGCIGPTRWILKPTRCSMVYRENMPLLEIL